MWEAGLTNEYLKCQYTYPWQPYCLISCHILPAVGTSKNPLIILSLELPGDFGQQYAWTQVTQASTHHIHLWAEEASLVTCEMQTGCFDNVLGLELPMSKPLLIKKFFFTWLLIGWRLYCEPVGSQVWIYCKLTWVLTGKYISKLIKSQIISNHKRSYKL